MRAELSRLSASFNVDGVTFRARQLWELFADAFIDVFDVVVNSERDETERHISVLMTAKIRLKLGLFNVDGVTFRAHQLWELFANVFIEVFTSS